MKRNYVHVIIFSVHFFTANFIGISLASFFYSSAFFYFLSLSLSLFLSLSLSLLIFLLFLSLFRYSLKFNKHNWHGLTDVFLAWRKFKYMSDYGSPRQILSNLYVDGGWTLVVTVATEKYKMPNASIRSYHWNATINSMSP